MTLTFPDLRSTLRKGTLAMAVTASLGAMTAASSVPAEAAPHHFMGHHGGFAHHGFGPHFGGWHHGGFGHGFGGWHHGGWGYGGWHHGYGYGGHPGFRHYGYWHRPFVGYGARFVGAPVVRYGWGWHCLHRVWTPWGWRLRRFC